jgi:hypothetical protein
LAAELALELVLVLVLVLAMVLAMVQELGQVLPLVRHSQQQLVWRQLLLDILIPVVLQQISLSSLTSFIFNNRQYYSKLMRVFIIIVSPPQVNCFIIHFKT